MAHLGRAQIWLWLGISSLLVSRGICADSLTSVNTTQPLSYIFMAPYQSTQAGPYIFDNEGNLIWSGYSSVGASDAFSFHTCDYNGVGNYLCFVNANQESGYARGMGFILDSSYEVVKSVKTGNGIPANDQHEFKILPGGEVALLTAYEQLRYDLSSYGILSQGWISQGVAQAINISSGAVLWNWNSLDHVDPSASRVAMGSTAIAGDGLSAATAWDYFHINAIDEDTAGNYLISSRHTSKLFAVSKADGSITWQLDGFNDTSASTFVLSNFNFSSQHYVRFRDFDPARNVTTISIFDNASDGNLTTNYQSAGKVIELDHGRLVATMTANFTAAAAVEPQGILSESQGDFQALPNGNWFLGFGDHAMYQESTADGEAVLFAEWAQPGSQASSYRTTKLNFTADPRDRPVAYAYAHNDTASTSLAASWNGCTRCAAWAFYGTNASSVTAAAMFTAATLGSMPADAYAMTRAARTGFETAALAQGFFAAYVFAEALDAEGRSLANSTTVATFVPGAALAPACDARQCPMAGQTLGDAGDGAGGDAGDAGVAPRSNGTDTDGTSSNTTTGTNGTGSDGGGDTAAAAAAQTASASSLGSVIGLGAAVVVAGWMLG